MFQRKTRRRHLLSRAENHGLVAWQPSYGGSGRQTASDVAVAADFLPVRLAVHRRRPDAYLRGVRREDCLSGSRVSNSRPPTDRLAGKRHYAATYADGPSVICAESSSRASVFNSATCLQLLLLLLVVVVMVMRHRCATSAHWCCGASWTD